MMKNCLGLFPFHLILVEFGACHPEWILFNGNCYMFSEESYPWRSAQRVCMEEEADLAIITDDDDQAFINGTSLIITNRN